MIRRRSAIEPAIGHMKTDAELGRKRLECALGDAMHVVRRRPQLQDDPEQAAAFFASSCSLPCLTVALLPT